ncbi:hypothetical protein [Streptomyces sp. NPDC046862]|uniref:hypothetical protein n=1 Tax=Streptomyces sp. NPDC046862 TaxID=3154603 RepID=UPI003456506D
MPDTTTSTSELTSHYIAQVTGDLENNTKEQERISAEIDALQELLQALQQDHTTLVNMRQALGATTTIVPSKPSAVPSPRAKKAAPAAPAKKSTAAKGGKTAKEPTAKKQTPKKPTAKSEASKTASQPTLVELIRAHLTEQQEPRSAAEVATALGQAHPDRRIQTTVVRTTLEGLVAKSHAQRSKQGSSVFYTASSADTPATTASNHAPAQAS